MELKNIVPWGRSLKEYKEMFSLSEVDLRKTILGCGDGPASFNAELTALGGNVVSIDPVYQFDTSLLKARINDVCDEIIPLMHTNKDKYIWSMISSVEELEEIRMAAMNTFISDYEEGKEAGRYIHQALPDLSFDDNQFDLALCSHFLFLYSAHIDLEQHINSIKELCRVAKEVRIYPLLTLHNEVSPHLEQVRSSLQSAKLTTSLVDVDYQFQKGATQMLVIKNMTIH